MKKISKRLLSVLLVLAMLIPTGAMAVTTSAVTVSIPDNAVEFNGHYYSVFKFHYTWTDADAYCKTLGGHLATITDSKEQNFVLDLIKNTGLNTCWIGLTTENLMPKWITGEKLGFENWADNNPDNAIDGEYYVHIYAVDHIRYGVTFQKAGQWNDVTNELKSAEGYDYNFYNLESSGFICEWEPNEQTITGKMTGSSNAPRIAIDGTWYEYDTTVPGLAEAIDKFALNEKITCKIRFGKITACSKTEINNIATLSVNTPNNNVGYDATTNKYNPEKIALSINITNRIAGTQSGIINTEYVAGYDITFDKLVIDVYDGDMLYFKDGWFGFGKTQKLEKEFDTPVTLKAGETFDFSEDLNAIVNDDYKWGDSETKKDVRIFAYAYNGDTLVAMDDQTITFKNKAAEDAMKNNSEFNNKTQNAANLLNNTACVIQNEFLSEIFTKEELKDISNALQCKVALCALPESTYKKAGISEKIMNKLMSKAGISKDWFGTAYTADISLVVNVDTQEYGQLEIEFSLPTTFYSFGSDNPFAGVSFDISYEITGGKGKKNVPKDKLYADTLGMLSYANIQAFADSVRDVALDQLESAYELGYGDDLNKVGEMLFGETITNILSKTKAKTYSHLTFSLMTFPSKQINIHCPVDVYVYDSDGVLCASVENNEITMTCDDIDIEVIGDEKYLTIYEGDYSIEIIATAEDDMNITIEEYSSTNEKLCSTTFDNIVLTPGDSFKTNIDENYLDSEYQINKNEEDVIDADSNKDYIHYINSVEIIDKEATCTENGVYHIECAECKETILSGTINTTGHPDTNHDGICDSCGDDFTADCGHICHSKNGIVQFFYKIGRFFWKLFGMQNKRYCDCGKAHW